MTPKYHIQPPGDGKIDIFLKQVSVGSTSVDTTMTDINEDDGFRKGVPQILLVSKN
ncbi:hypothetical protein D3C86_2074830 [compost metagenome]